MSVTVRRVMPVRSWVHRTSEGLTTRREVQELCHEVHWSLWVLQRCVVAGPSWCCRSGRCTDRVPVCGLVVWCLRCVRAGVYGRVKLWRGPVAAGCLDS